MTKKVGWFSVSLAMIYMGVTGAKAGDDFSDYFQYDKYEVTLASGVMFSPIGADRNRHTVDYSLSGLQLGWMFTEPGQSAWWRGNWELAVEAMGGGVFEGRGNYFAGGTAWVRYNFVQPGWRVVPYVQTGAGAEATDMDQRLIGETFNFNLGVSAGARYFVAQNWALITEFRYQHISNATIARHDIGINAVGPMVGVSFFF
ncbi:MAG TPA: acyloxyacyl hydrolase [Verrucomicrobiae bacterium]|jgi:opacity protein-like surface antigen|nr:acyloxyacyl hydrolase [Verrucomicrobiae bacterium]